MTIHHHEHHTPKPEQHQKLYEFSKVHIMWPKLERQRCCYFAFDDEIRVRFRNMHSIGHGRCVVVRKRQARRGRHCKITRAAITINIIIGDQAPRWVRSLRFVSEINWRHNISDGHRLSGAFLVNRLLSVFQLKPRGHDAMKAGWNNLFYSPLNLELVWSAWTFYFPPPGDIEYDLCTDCWKDQEVGIITLVKICDMPSLLIHESIARNVRNN